MASTTIRMPQLGESVVEGTVGKWLVQVGQRIESDQPVVEILTDKADSEVPSPQAGCVAEIWSRKATVIAVGRPLLCKVDPAARAGRLPPRTEAVPGARKPASRRAADAAPRRRRPHRAAARRAGHWQWPPPSPPPSSPSVRKLAREQGVDSAASPGYGRRRPRHARRRAARDARRAARVGASGAACGPPRGRRRSAPCTPGSGGLQCGSGRFGRVSRAALRRAARRPGRSASRRRRIIADHMVYSKLTSPHVVDVRRVRPAQDRRSCASQHKDRLKARGREPDHAWRSSAPPPSRALREHRAMNARVLDDAYVLLARHQPRHRGRHARRAWSCR